MTIPLTPGRRARARAAGPPAGSTSGSMSGPTSGPTSADDDALAELRRQLARLDPDGFAACFSPSAWVRVPRPEGDVVLRGRPQIAQAGYELRAMVAELTWTP